MTPDHTLTPTFSVDYEITTILLLKPERLRDFHKIPGDPQMSGEILGEKTYLLTILYKDILIYRKYILTRLGVKRGFTTSVRSLFGHHFRVLWDDHYHKSGRYFCASGKVRRW